VPALTVSGDIDKSKHLQNLTVNGDVEVAGKISGNTKLMQVNGSLTYGDTADDNMLGVTGKKTKKNNSPPVIDLTNLQTLGTPYKVKNPSTGYVFDFTTIPGPEAVIYVDGDVTNPVFIGSGTLYASKKISFNKNGDLDVGDVNNPVYLVSADKIEVKNSQDNMTVYGGLYANKDLNIDADALIYGPVVVDGKLNFKGKNHETVINEAPGPFFDPRNATAPVKKIIISGFKGPQP
jgi:hypothetical protein